MEFLDFRREVDHFSRSFQSKVIAKEKSAHYETQKDVRGKTYFKKMRLFPAITAAKPTSSKLNFMH